jgi:PhzF family phenazine biosynthesis protein
MPYTIFQVDAFTNEIFKGNPACVVPLKEWLPDATMQQLAMENAVAETAFFVATETGFHIRWFTPELEMDLCGHATLATAHVLKQHLGYTETSVTFDSRSGPLSVEFMGNLYELDFPNRMPEPADLPKEISDALNLQPVEVHKSRDYFLVYNTQADIDAIKVNLAILSQIDLGEGGVIVTAKGQEVDFVSRFFTPNASMPEDHVTGSAHCSLIPFWAKRLNQDMLVAQQRSPRTGMLYCQSRGPRVKMAGEARTYMIGEFYLD